MKPRIRTIQEILNKNFSINYKNAFFSFKIDDTKNITWTLKVGNKVIEQISSVFLKQINDNVVVLEWINEDDTIVSKEINLESNTVDCRFFDKNKSENFIGKIYLN